MSIKKYYILAIIFLLFTLLILPAAGMIYHQDEYSWIVQMNGQDTTPQIHPPLYLLLGRGFGLMVGFNHERWLTVPFALANVILVYAISMAISHRRRIGLLAAGLFAVNAYSILAATMVDIDGALLPFFVLLMYLAYLRVLEGWRRWYAVLALAIIGGLFSKLSFVIGLGAIAADAIIRMLVEYKISPKIVIRTYWVWIIAALGVMVLIYGALIHFLPDIATYGAHFKINDFRTRKYLDLIYKILKSVILLGPLVFWAGLSVFFRPAQAYRYRFLCLYLLFSTLFYTVIFDFTNLTIERYFMFMIAPLAILAAEPVNELIKTIRSFKPQRSIWLFGLGGTVILLSLLLLPYDTLPLNPKIEYFRHILSGHWNFLIPISGGSGPIGFYVPALYMAAAWVISLGALIIARYSGGRTKARATALFISVGVATLIIVLGEFLFGTMYGSASNIAWQTVNYVNGNLAITKVITYYDIAPYDLRVSGKYFSRFYTSPTRNYVPKVTDFRGHYMIVNFPEIGEDSVYWKLIQRCPIEKEFQDKKMHSYVFDCTKLPPS